MSQGTFNKARYEANSGEIHPIRIQPETITSWNPEATGSASADRSYFRATPSRRKQGQFARYATITKPVGTTTGPFTGARVYKRVPILTIDAWTALAFGQDLTYNSVTGFELCSKEDERIL